MQRFYLNGGLESITLEQFLEESRDRPETRIGDKPAAKALISEEERVARRNFLGM